MLLPSVPGLGNSAGVRETGRFFDRQRIHVSAQHDGGTVPVTQNADHARLADSRGDLESDFLEMVRRNSRSASLLHREFGVSVNVLVNSLQVREHGVQRRKHLSWFLHIGHLNSCAIILPHDPKEGTLEQRCSPNAIVTGCKPGFQLQELRETLCSEGLTSSCQTALALRSWRGGGRWIEARQRGRLA